MGVPPDLVNAVATVYQAVWVKFTEQDEGIASTLGVIQGCPTSPKLFGVLIDDLFWTTARIGVKLGDSSIRMLIFVDEVVILSTSAEELQREIVQLEDILKDGTRNYVDVPHRGACRKILGQWTSLETGYPSM
ncbi:hypothetical protein R1sor_027249 [Riccia sorocarpa]|uniref:Reverse transcriptase domain-containing protein n=1 Tax=Riccia sorocarpa TaxID=122646 RepID=A0ABD3GF63_9MARC